MKPDEIKFLMAMQKFGSCPYVERHFRDGYKSPRDLFPELDMHHKRMWYLLDKWTGKDWYEFGVCIDLGWLTYDGFYALV